jgi:Zn finger protein HypA/HybF involved in hydrogenase expression
METQVQNPYSEVLQMFVTKDNRSPDNEWRLQPFVIDNRLFSTNNHVVVWINGQNKIDASLYKGVEADKSEKVLSIISVDLNLEKHIPISAIQQALDKVPQEAEMKWVGKDITCTECKGEGEVEWEYKTHTKDFECPKCHGEGLSAKAKQVPTGRTMPEKYSKVKIGNCYISGVILMELVNCADVLDKQIVTLVHQTEAKKPTIFLIDEVHFLVMPMLKDEYDFYEVVEITI